MVQAITTTHQAAVMPLEHAKAAAASQLNCDITTVANEVFGRRYEAIENKLRGFLHEQNENNQKIQELQQLQQLLRTKSAGADFSKDEETQALLKRAEGYGLVLPNSTFIFNKKEIETLLSNSDSTISSLSSISQMRLMQYQQASSDRTMAIEMWTSTIKRAHEDAMAVIRNLGGR